MGGHSLLCILAEVRGERGDGNRFNAETRRTWRSAEEDGQSVLLRATRCCVGACVEDDRIGVPQLRGREAQLLEHVRPQVQSSSGGQAQPTADKLGTEG